LELASPLDEPFGDMDISGASDATMSGLSVAYNLALPFNAPNCSSNILAGLSNIVDDMYLNDQEDLGSIYTKKVNLKIDSGPGHSGSPVYYCPDGPTNLCAGSETGFVLALISGWNGFETTIVGPKAPAFRDWGTDIMDTN
jgi:hypothetical protein